MASRKSTPVSSGLEYGPSVHAKKAWKADELKLPKPFTSTEMNQIPPSRYLRDILHFARSAESRGEWLFRQNYLLPTLKHLVDGQATDNLWEDGMGNIIVHVGENPWNVLHVGHIDTVHGDDISPYQDYNVSPEGVVTLADIIKHSMPVLKTGVRWVNGVRSDHAYLEYDLPPKIQRSLGADDGCAVATMLYLIANRVEATYVFARGEEIGCLGTHYMLDKLELPIGDFKIAVEVDRAGKTDIVTSMAPGITASAEFGLALAAQLGLGHKAARGTITDVGYFAKLVPECVNLSAGYAKQHGENESADLVYLDTLGARLLAVDWDVLPIVRLPNAYAAPVVATQKIYPIQPSRYSTYSDDIYESSYKGYTSKANSFGDWTTEPTGVLPISSQFTQPYAVTAWIRSNVNLLAEFLVASDLSIDNIVNIAQYGVDEDELDSIDLDNEIILTEEDEDIIDINKLIGDSNGNF